MGLPQQTSTAATEKPSTSETQEAANQSTVPQTSTNPLRHVSDPNQVARGAMGGGSTGNAEAAAEKLYEERMEEEYAKREGGA